MRIFLDNKGVGTLWSQFKAKLAAHADDSDIHVTAAEKAKLDGVANEATRTVYSQILVDGVKLGELTINGSGPWGIYAPSSLPANGGNADTLDGLHANEIASNPNLLINPDFRINQRGLSEYTSGYTVDRWSLDPNKASVSVGTDGVRITAANDITSNTHVFWQRLEFPLPPGKYTLSVNVKEVTGLWSARIRTVTADGTYAGSYYVPAFSTGVNKVSVDLPENEYISAVSVGVSNGTEAGDSVKLEWIKLEPGSGATTFLPPDYATELAKCQRYFIRLKNAFGWIGSGFTNKTLARCVIPLPTTMRISPTVTLNGKIYTNTPTSVGDGAIECANVRSDIAYMQNAIGAGFDLPEGSTSAEPCFMQFRDSESYIDISAEL